MLFFCVQVLRFMGDPHLNGAQENLFGNYIVQRGLLSPGLRDEVLAQVVNQVWRNINSDNADRGWLLLLACVCCFAPSTKMDKYLLKWDFFPFDVNIIHPLKTICQKTLFIQPLRQFKVQMTDICSPGLCQTTPQQVIRPCCNTDSSKQARRCSCVQAPPPRLHGRIRCHSWSGQPIGREQTWCCTCTVLMVTWLFVLF